VADWLYGVCAGISVCEDGAGYKHFLICPHTDERLGFVNCSLDTENGKIESNWYYKNDRVYFEFSVPQGSVATLILPNGKTQSLLSGRYNFSCSK
jgi:alpha-L-rhamnosidase